MGRRQIGIIYDERDVSDTLSALLRLLAERFGAEGIVRLGLPRERRKNFAHCDLVLVVIGASWLAPASASGHRWLDDRANPARRAIVRALRRYMTLIPLLLDGAHIPPAAELPAPLRRVIRTQAIAVRVPELLDDDFAHLATAIAAYRRWRPATPGLLGLCGVALLLALAATTGVLGQPITLATWHIAAFIAYGSGLIALSYALRLRRWAWILVLMLSTLIASVIFIVSSTPGVSALVLYLAGTSVPLIFSLVGPRTPITMPVPLRLAWGVYVCRQDVPKGVPVVLARAGIQPPAPPSVPPSYPYASGASAPVHASALAPHPSAAPLPYPYPYPLPQDIPASAAPPAFPFAAPPSAQPGHSPYSPPTPVMPAAVMPSSPFATPASPVGVAPRTNRVFLSYRRGEGADICGLLQHDLAAALGPRSVFMDLDAIAPGANFTFALVAALSQCDVMLVLIGPTWATEADASGAPRLAQRSDFVRIEVETALSRHIRVIPVLIHGAQMPPPAQLPSSLRPLLRRPALVIHDGERRAADVAAVVAATARRRGLALSYPSVVWSSLVALGVLALALFTYALTAILPSPVGGAAWSLAGRWLLLASVLCGLWGGNRALRRAFQIGPWPWSVALAGALGAVLLAPTLIVFQPLLAAGVCVLAQAVVLIFGWRGPRVPMKLPV